MQTELENREYCFTNNKALLDADATYEELREFNQNVQQAKVRAHDESIHKLVRQACEKYDIDQNLDRPHKFAYRCGGRIYPENLRPQAMQRLMNKYEQDT